MAFKKAKGKAGKKKSKKSGGKRDEWSHEGGVVLDGKDDENEEIGGKRKRRTTQDREESIRRGKMKNHDRKKKTDFWKKMSKKVNFGDVVAKMHGSDDEQSDEEDESLSTTKNGYIRSNPLSVVDRLQKFLSKSSQQHDDSVSANSDDDEEEVDDQIEEDEEEYDMEDINGSDNEEEEEEEEEEEMIDQDVNEDDGDDHTGGDSDSDHENNTILSSKYEYYYNRMFYTEHNEDEILEENEKNKMKLIQKIPNFSGEIYGNLRLTNDSTEKNILPIASGPYNNISEIPGLYKLFHNKSAYDRINPMVFPGINSYLLPYLSSYADIFLEGRDHGNDEEMLQGILLHTIAHTVKARAKVVRHNQKLKRKLQNSLIAAAVSKETKKSNTSTTDTTTKHKNEEEDDNTNDIMRDQGYCRPRILILCPFRSTAYRIVEKIRSILGENTSISNWEKFIEEFGVLDDSDTEDKDSKKPEDWKAMFDKQNIDDDFKMGVQLNPGHGKGSGAEKGVYMRLFSDFFISDIILASPIGLRLAIESSSNNSKNKENKEKNKNLNNNVGSDFLSSIECVLLHQSDVMYMQNWEHIEYIMKLVNKLPKNYNNDIDFSRVKQYFLEGKGYLYRQLILTTSFNNPEIQSFYRNYSTNYNGNIRLKYNYQKGQLSNVCSGAKQVFQLVPNIKDFLTQEDMRFKYFKEHILAPILRLQQKHTLIVTPSYLSYVRVRNELMNQEVSAAYVCEYSRDSEISRGRSHFFHGTKDILLYSGRAHFFRRYLMRGAHHVIFYSLPEYAHFYSEIVNMLSKEVGKGSSSANSGSLDEVGISCLVLYTPYERMALERVVGAKRCAQMIAGAKATFVFT